LSPILLARADEAFKWRRVSDRVQRSNRYHQESNIVRPAQEIVERDVPGERLEPPAPFLDLNAIRNARPDQPNTELCWSSNFARPSTVLWPYITPNNDRLHLLSIDFY
jgi:hypothetical protein